MDFEVPLAQVSPPLGEVNTTLGLGIVNTLLLTSKFEGLLLSDILILQIDDGLLGIVQL
jgi:hypothetical protein